jgi:hypothetical protein
MAGVTSPIVLFGAFDRHNLGDLLFPHVATALLPGQPLRFAGLARRDMRAWGGHEVEALADLAAEAGDRPARLLHVGGEILTCSAWQAAVMLQPAGDAQATIARLEARPAQRERWARDALRVGSRAPYCVAREAWPGLRRVVYAGVGGVDLDTVDGALRDEVLAGLAQADLVAVRDACTFEHLRRAGIAAHLVPDPAVLVADLFGDRVREHGGRGEVAAVRAALADGYVAVQFAAEFGDDATLDAIAAQLDRVAADTGLGVAFFRAGAAPWHDDLDTLGRAASRLRVARAQVFGSLDLWDCCALIAGSRAFCGSSLHGRIVATAFGLPRLNLRAPGTGVRPTKQEAFATTWEVPGVPGTMPVGELAVGLHRALAVAPQVLAATADRLAAECRRGFESVRRALGVDGG